MIYFLSCYTGVGDRIWCGDGANPPGIFASFLIDINLFRNVPILRDWGISASGQMYVFITTEEQLSENTQINIIDDLTDMRNKVQRFFNLLTDFSSQFGNQLSTAIKNSLSDFQNSTTSFIAQLHSAINGEIKLKTVLSVAKDIWKTYTTDIKHTARHIIDDLEFDTSVIANNLTELIESEIARIGRNIDSTISKIRNNVMSLASKFTGFGFRLAAFVKIFNLEFSSMDIELIYSVDSLGRCSKFQEVYEIMKGEKALRILLRSTKRIKLGYFLSSEVGGFSIISMNIQIDKFVMHTPLHVEILGMRVSGDLLINNNGMLIRIEGPIWKVFFARIELSSEIGKKWNDLMFNVKGTFGVAERSSDFEGSLLDGMRQLTRQLADSANNRFQAAQERLSRAQNSLASTQKKLTDAQEYIEKCHSKFDDAIERLDAAKNSLEKAKAPYQDARERLRKAQRNVDNLCKISSCNSICVGGLSWSVCKRGWIKYPCSSWNGCSYRIPNKPCEMKNAACKAVRDLAYNALENVKVFVRLPIMLYDAAEVALSIAQIVVDNARVILGAAQGTLEVAKAGLEVAKLSLEVAKGAIETVKFNVRAALYVFDLMVSDLQNIIDVKNCGFEIQMSTTDKAFFDVSCDIKAFSLGWTTFRFGFDFRHPITSMLRTAKAIVKVLFDSITYQLGKRRKREISFLAMSKLHLIIKLYKREALNDTNYQSIYLNTSLSRNEREQVETDFQRSYYDRVVLFEKNCVLFQNVYSFLFESINDLLKSSNEMVEITKHFTQYKDVINKMTESSTTNNMTADAFGISREYALKDYNITSEDLDAAIENVKISLSDDPLLNEFKNVTKLAIELIDKEINEVNSVPIVGYWIVGMENLTTTYFEENDCSGFEDCVLYAFSSLYDLFIDGSLGDGELNRNLTSSLENEFHKLIENTNMPVTAVYTLSADIIDGLSDLKTSQLFCSKAPEITNLPRNITILATSNTNLICDATGDPMPQITWYQNDVVLENQSILELTNISELQKGTYKCTAENVVSLIWSEIFATVQGKHIKYSKVK